MEYSIPHYSSFLAIQVVRSASRGSLPDSTRFPTFLLANPQRLPPPPTGSADVIITQKCSVEHPSSPTSKFATYISQGPLEKRIPTGPTSPEGGAGKEGKKDGREEGAGGGGGAMVFPLLHSPIHLAGLSEGMRSREPYTRPLTSTCILVCLLSSGCQLGLPACLTACLPVCLDPLNRQEVGW